LGIIKNELTVTNDYEVILISGHRGCGKTSDLKKLHSKLNKPEPLARLGRESKVEAFLGNRNPHFNFF
jgi:predicted AAA+ superfamily ATPase